MDALDTSLIPSAYHLTRHGGVRLITRTRLDPDALLHQLNERQSVIVERGSSRKPRLFLVYSQPDDDFFVVAVNQRTRGIITVLPLRFYEYRIPGNPRIVPLKDLLYARSRVTLAQLRAAGGPPSVSGAIVHLKMVFRRREGHASREWRETFSFELQEEGTPIDVVETEKALLAYPGFLEKMGDVLSGCSGSWPHVYRMFAEIQEFRLPKMRRKIEMPWTGLSIEQAADPKSCERFPALQGLALEDDEEHYDRYSCPVDTDEKIPAHLLSGAECFTAAAGAASYG
jgi:hypothetical protein